VLVHTVPLPETQSAKLEDGRVIGLPAPAVWTDTTSKAYRDWAKLRCVRYLAYRDQNGNTIVGHFLAAGHENHSPEIYAFIIDVQRYRPDGTREVETTYIPYGRPIQTISYGPDGQSMIMKVHYDDMKDSPLNVIRLELPKENGGFTTYRIGTDGIARPE